MPVPRRVGRREDHGAVEERQDVLPARSPVAIPQLEVAAPLLLPLPVQIDEKVQAPVELQFRMDVEVGVHLQESARLDLMETAAPEVGIGDEAVDAGERLEPEQHLEAVHVVEKLADRFRDAAALVEVAELLLQRIVELHPSRALAIGEIAQHRLELGVVEEAVDHDVWKRLRVAIPLRECARVAAKGQRRHDVTGLRKSTMMSGEYVTHPAGDW